LALTELFGWLSYFREKRRRENLSQVQLLKQELVQIGLALVGVVVLMGMLAAIAWARSEQNLQRSRQSRQDGKGHV
jgi:hypothetical protein